MKTAGLLLVATALYAGPAQAGGLLDKIKAEMKKVDDIARKANDTADTANGAASAATGKKPAGTPAGTAQKASGAKDLLAAKAYSDGDLTANGMDILGVKLGMSPDEVIAVLRAKNISLTQSKQLHQYPRASGDLASGNTTPDPFEWPAITLNGGNIAAGPRETLSIAFTPEETPRAYHVSRHVQLDPGTQLYDPWQKAVFEKYGQPMSGAASRNAAAAGGDFTWAKAPPAPGCGYGGSNAFLSLPTADTAVKAQADRAEKCGPWTLWVRAGGRSPYLEQYDFELTGYGMMDVVTRALREKVVAHSTARDAANQEHANQLANKRPDL